MEQELFDKIMAGFESAKPWWARGEGDNAFVRGVKTNMQGAGIARSLATGDYEAAARKVRDLHAYQQRNRPSEDQQRLLDAYENAEGSSIAAMGREFLRPVREGEGLAEKAKGLAGSVSGVGAMLAEQLPNMAMPMLGQLGGQIVGRAGGGLAGGAVGSAVPGVGNATGAAVGGVVGGLGGGWAGASLGNAVVELPGYVTESLREAGIDPSDTEAVREHLAANRGEIFRKSGIKGSIIGAVDVASLGLGGKILRGPGKKVVGRALADMGIDTADRAAVRAAMQTPEFAQRVATDAAYQASQRGARKLARNTAAFATEPGGEYLGEFLGTLAAEGDWSPEAIRRAHKEGVLEAFMSLGQSGTTFAGQKAWQYATSPRGQQRNADDGAAAPPDSGATGGSLPTADEFQATGNGMPVTPENSRLAAGEMTPEMRRVEGEVVQAEADAARHAQQEAEYADMLGRNYPAVGEERGWTNGGQGEQSGRRTTPEVDDALNLLMLNARTDEQRKHAADIDAVLQMEAETPEQLRFQSVLGATLLDWARRQREEGGQRVLPEPARPEFQGTGQGMPVREDATEFNRPDAAMPEFYWAANDAASGRDAARARAEQQQAAAAQQQAQTEQAWADASNAFAQPPDRTVQRDTLTRAVETGSVAPGQGQRELPYTPAMTWDDVQLAHAQDARNAALAEQAASGVLGKSLSAADILPGDRQNAARLPQGNIAATALDMMGLNQGGVRSFESGVAAEQQQAPAYPGNDPAMAAAMQTTARRGQVRQGQQQQPVPYPGNPQVPAMPQRQEQAAVPQAPAQASPDFAGSLRETGTAVNAAGTTYTVRPMTSDPNRYQAIAVGPDGRRRYVSGNKGVSYDEAMLAARAASAAETGGRLDADELDREAHERKQERGRARMNELQSQTWGPEEMPPELAERLDNLERQMNQGEAGRKFFTGGQGEETVVTGVGSTNPVWMRQVKRGETPDPNREILSGAGKKGIIEVLRKWRAGKTTRDFTARQWEIWSALQGAAWRYGGSDQQLDAAFAADPDAAQAYEDYQYASRHGFPTPEPQNVMAGELNPGDQVLIRDRQGDLDVATVRKPRAGEPQGDIVLKDGVARYYDFFEDVEVEGIQRAGEADASEVPQPEPKRERANPKAKKEKAKKQAEKDYSAFTDADWLKLKPANERERILREFHVYGRDAQGARFVPTSTAADTWALDITTPEGRKTSDVGATQNWTREQALAAREAMADLDGGGRRMDSRGFSAALSEHGVTMDNAGNVVELYHEQGRGYAVSVNSRILENAGWFADKGQAVQRAAEMAVLSDNGNTSFIEPEVRQESGGQEKRTAERTDGAFPGMRKHPYTDGDGVQYDIYLPPGELLHRDKDGQAIIVAGRVLDKRGAPVGYAMRRWEQPTGDSSAAARNDRQGEPASTAEQAQTQKGVSEEEKTNRAKAEHALMNEGVNEIEDASRAVRYRIVEHDGGYFVQTTLALDGEGKGVLFKNMVQNWRRGPLPPAQGYNQKWTREQAVEALLDMADFKDHRQEWREKEMSREVFVERLENGSFAPSYPTSERGPGVTSGYSIVQTGARTFELRQQELSPTRTGRNRLMGALVGKYRTKQAAIDAAVAQVPRFAQPAGDSSASPRNDRQGERTAEPAPTLQDFKRLLKETGEAVDADGNRYVFDQTGEFFNLNVTTPDGKTRPIMPSDDNNIGKRDSLIRIAVRRAGETYGKPARQQPPARKVKSLEREFDRLRNALTVRKFSPEERKAKLKELDDLGKALRQARLDATQSDDGVRYSVADDAVPEGDRLVTLHNLTEESLLFADRLGGLPVPSLGVTKAATPYTGFGDISLIGTSGMVDPRQTPVFGGDAYTGRMPQLARETDNGATIEIDGKEVPLTLENVVRAMISGKEPPFSLNTIRAKSVGRFKDMRELRNARGGLVSSREARAVRNRLADRADEYAVGLAQYAENPSDRQDVEALRALADAAGKNGTKAEIAAALEQRGFRNVPDDMVENGARLLADIKTQVVDYYEAKPQRAVALSEFAGAVVPSDISPEARAVLERAGLKIREYDRNEKGGRDRATTELSAELNAERGDILYQRPAQSDGPTRANGRPARREGESLSDYNRRVKEWNDRRKAELKAATDLLGRLVPGLSVRNTSDLDGDIGKLKGRVRQMRNSRGLVIGAYHPGSKTVLLTADADAATALHEIGWHAVYDWARTNAPVLYRQMRDYAQSAPESVKQWVKDRYGDFSAEALLDEIGAKLFTESGRKEFEQAVQDRAGRSWYQKVADLFRDLWNRFTGANRADLGAYRGLSPEAAMGRLMEDIKAGRRLESGVRSVESGVDRATRDMLVRYAKAMGVSPKQLEREYKAVKARYENDPSKWRMTPDGKKRSKLNERQWILVRTPRFKAWFGNWELKHKDFAIVELEDAPFNNTDAAIAWAKANDILGVMTNEETGGKGEISISISSIREMLNPGQREQSVSNAVHHAALMQIKNIIRESEIVDSHPDYKKGKNGKRSPQAGINPGVSIDVLYGAVKTDSGIYRVKTTIKRYADANAGDKAYTYHVEDIKVLAGTLGNDANATTPSASTSISGNSLLQGVRKVNQNDGTDGALALDDFSKVVDENGEPMVVYHQTGEDFTVFEPRRPGAGQYDEQLPFGIFLKPDDGDIGLRGKRQMALFANIKNPFRVADRAELVEYLKRNIPDYADLLLENDRQNAEYRRRMDALRKEVARRYDEWKTQHPGEGRRNDIRLKIQDELGERALSDEWIAAENNLAAQMKELVDKHFRESGYDGIILERDEGGFGKKTTRSIIAFERNQVKSATDNTGAFDPNDPDIRYTFAGEQGAAALDAAEEGTHRLDNLAVAREMEAAGKDAKTVKLATGWERGKDGKWRYEIDDSANTFHFSGDLVARRDWPGYAEDVDRINELGRKANSAMLFGTEGLTEEEQAEFDRLRQKRRGDMEHWRQRMERGNARLMDVLDAPELFRAYPQLENVRVLFDSWLPDNVNAQYNVQRNTIALNEKRLMFRQEDIPSVLHHEIQHAIQVIEGFAPGGNLETFATNDEGMVNVGRQMSDSLLERAKQVWDAASPELREKFREMNRAKIAEDFNELDRLEAALSDDESKAWSDYSTAMDTALEYRKKGHWKTPGEAYEALAGEVEARNTSRRLTMTAEERRASLAEETEDVAREDQIVLERMLGGTAASAETVEKNAQAETAQPPVESGADGKTVAHSNLPGDAKLSVSSAVPVSDRADIEAELAEAIGKGRARKLLHTKNGNIRVIETQEETRRLVGADNETVKRAANGTIQGFYLNGVAYLVRDGIARGNVMAVLMHEYGEHAAQLGFRGNVGYRAILKSLENRQHEDSATGKAIREAMERVPEGTPAEHYWSEVAAYLVEANANIKTTALDRVTNFFKKWLFNVSGLGVDNFTHKDLVLFARAAVKAAGRENVPGNAESFDSRGKTLQPAFMSMKDTKERMIAAAAEQMGVPLEQLQAEYEAVAKRYEGQPRNAPNGTASNLTEEQWTLARTPSFLRKYGNWLYKPDTTVEPVDLSGVTLDVDFRDTKALKKWLADKYVGQTVTIDSDGAVVGFSTAKLNASLKRRGEEQRTAYARLEKLIGNAIYFDFDKNDGQEKHFALSGQDIYYAAMRIGGKMYSVKFKFDVAKDDASRIYKDHKVVDIQITPAGAADASTGAVGHSSLVYHVQAQDGLGSPHARTDETLSVTVGDLTGGVKPGNVSISLDANGEPTADAFPNTTDDGGGPNGGQASGGPRFSIAASSPAAPNPANNNAVTGQSFIDRILDNAAPKWRDMWERFIYNFIDSNDPRERVWRRAGSPADKDFVTIERLRGKKAAAEQKKFREEMVTPLLKTLGEGKLSVSDLEEYAHALHTPERNQRMREVNAKRNLDALAQQMPDAEKANLKAQMDFISKNGRQAGWTESDIHRAYLDLLENALNDIPARERAQNAAERALSPNSSQAEINRVAKGRERLEEAKKIRDKWRRESIRFAGQTDAEAAATIQNWQGDSRYAALQKAHKQLSDITAATLDVLHDSGQLDDEEYLNLKNGYQFYVPLHREGFLDTRPPLPMQTAKGSSRKVVNILANTVRVHEGVIGRKHKAEAGRALYEFAMAHPDAGITVEELEKKPTHDREGNIVMYTSQAEPEDGIFIRVNGKKHLLRFAVDKHSMEGRTLSRFLDSVKGADAQLNGLTQMLHTATRWLAMVNTSLSPEFVVTNFSRDLQTAFAHLNQEDIDMPGLQSAVAKDIFPAMRGIWAAEQGRKNGAMARWYADYEANGGKVGWMRMYEDTADLAKKLEEELKLHQDGHHILKARTHMMELVEHANAAIENCMRLATYKGLVERGVSRQRAARVASALTVDFTQHGKLGPQINALYMFWNASVQGTVRMVQAMASSKKVRAIAGGIAGAGFVLQMLALAGGGDDDSGEPYILGIPDAIRERNIIIMLPGGEGKYIKIPKAYGYGALYDFGAELANSIYMGAQGRKYSHTAGAMRVVNSFANSFNPIQSATILQTLAPTLLDPVVYVAENKSWTGQPLMPEQNPYGPQKPDSERSWKGTSPVWKKTAKILNDMTGGDSYRSGWADVSPETFSMLWDNATGGMGRFVGNVVALPMTVASGDTEAHRVPFARQVYGEWQDRAISSRYYEAMDRAEVAHMRFRNAENLAERKRLYQEPDHKLYLQSRQAERQIRLLRKRQQLMEAAGDRDGAERVRKRIVERQAEVLKMAV